MSMHTLHPGVTRHRHNQRVRITNPHVRRAAVIASVAALMYIGPAASAHDAITSTNPADGTQLEVVPGQIELLFNNVPLSVGVEVQVTGPDGDVVSTDAAQVIDTSVIQTVAPNLPAGGYRVLWRVTSSDGHPLSGEFGFTATTGAAAPPEPTPEPTPPAPTASTDTAEPPASTASAQEGDSQDAAVGQTDGISPGARIGIGIGAIGAVGAATAFMVRRFRHPSN